MATMVSRSISGAGADLVAGHVERGLVHPVVEVDGLPIEEPGGPLAVALLDRGAVAREHPADRVVVGGAGRRAAELGRRRQRRRRGRGDPGLGRGRTRLLLAGQQRRAGDDDSEEAFAHPITVTLTLRRCGALRCSQR
jgi:hypothetical protein